MPVPDLLSDRARRSAGDCNHYRLGHSDRTHDETGEKRRPHWQNYGN